MSTRDSNWSVIYLCDGIVSDIDEQKRRSIFARILRRKNEIGNTGTSQNSELFTKGCLYSSPFCGEFAIKGDTIWRRKQDSFVIG